jgi:hypothetical protein
MTPSVAKIRLASATTRLEGLSAQDRRVLDHIDRIRSTGRVILTKDRVNEGRKRGNGYFTRMSYMAVYDISDFESDRSGYLCVPKNLDSDVLMMQPANQGIRHNASNPLNWARDRRILSQRTMSSRRVVIARIGF